MTLRALGVVFVLLVVQLAQGLSMFLLEPPVEAVLLHVGLGFLTLLVLLWVVILTRRAKHHAAGDVTLVLFLYLVQGSLGLATYLPEEQAALAKPLHLYFSFFVAASAAWTLVIAAGEQPRPVVQAAPQPTRPAAPPPTSRQPQPPPQKLGEDVGGS